MPPADKRARKKENARAAREQREAALRRKKRTRSTITVGVVVALFVAVIVLINVAGDDENTASTTTSVATTTTVAVPDVALDPSKTYKATMTTNLGTITLEMDVKTAPKAAAHFVTLARKGFYDGSRWHRIIKDFVVQGGAPEGDLSKGYGQSVVGEVPTGEYKIGDVAAAKGDTDPAGTFDAQFFIVTGSQGVALPPDYAKFAHVTSGMDVVRKIEALETRAGDEPTEKATIDKVTITES